MGTKNSNNKDNNNYSETTQPTKQIINYPNSKSGWVMARMKNNKRYKKRYCILSSDNVLSFYEYDMPRPHGLKSQVVLRKNLFLQISTIHNPNNQHLIERYILTVFTNKKIKKNDSNSNNNNKEYFKCFLLMLMIIHYGNLLFILLY